MLLGTPLQQPNSIRPCDLAALRLPAKAEQAALCFQGESCLQLLSQKATNFSQKQRTCEVSRSIPLCHEGGTCLAGSPRWEGLVPNTAQAAACTAHAASLGSRTATGLLPLLNLSVPAFSSPATVSCAH